MLHIVLYHNIVIMITLNNTTTTTNNADNNNSYAYANNNTHEHPLVFTLVSSAMGAGFEVQGKRLHTRNHTSEIPLGHANWKSIGTSLGK